MRYSEEVFNEVRNEGRKEGRNEGRNEGKLQALFELIKDGIVTIEIAAKKANMSIEDFCKQMKLAGY